MDALSLHSKILDGYKDYIQSFIDIHDGDILEKVEESLRTRKLWPEPLIQFNPSFEKNGSVNSLLAKGTFTTDTARDAIHHLRSLHRDRDQAILTAYSWHQPGPDGPAIELGHDFHQVETLPENDRTRYTITPQARKDLLTRLLKLNHQRAAEEAAAQATQSPASKSITPKKAQRAKQEDELL